MAPYKAYQASDGWVVIAAANDNLFRRFSKAVGDPQWADDPEMNTNSNRVRNREKVNALVAAVIIKEAACILDRDAGGGFCALRAACNRSMKC